MKKIRDILRIMNRSRFVGERYEQNIRDMSYLNAVAFALGLALFCVNVAAGDYVPSLSPLALVVIASISDYMIRMKRNRVVFVALYVLTLTSILTYDTLVLCNGFAFLWTMLVPMVSCYLYGIREGAFLTLYFLILFDVAFYTPVRDMLSGYSDIVMQRFPILYFFNAVMTLYVMFQYHKSVLWEIDYTERLNAEVARQTAVAVQRGNKLGQLSEQMLETLARTIDAKDKYTNGHSFRVMRYSVALARQLGWDERQIPELRREALLHDIGKIGVPDAVLNKPERLNATEFDVIQSHTTVGRRILSGLECMEGAALVAGSHHERYDGKGYPEGLRGEEIPEHARVVAIADTYDAMSSNRVYRKALPAHVILREMRKQSGKQFDPVFLEAFLTLLESGALERTEQAES